VNLGLPKLAQDTRGDEDGVGQRAEQHHAAHLLAAKACRSTTKRGAEAATWARDL
jgi:hypothetical protein